MGEKTIKFGQFTGALICPKCNEENTHLAGYAPYYEKDGRLCLNLLFQCETCKKNNTFSVLIAQHEGFTYIKYKNLDYMLDEPNDDRR